MRVILLGQDVEKLLIGQETEAREIVTLCLQEGSETLHDLVNLVVLLFETVSKVLARL